MGLLDGVLYSCSAVFPLTMGHHRSTAITVPSGSLFFPIVTPSKSGTQMRASVGSCVRRSWNSRRNFQMKGSKVFKTGTWELQLCEYYDTNLPMEFQEPPAPTPLGLLAPCRLRCRLKNRYTVTLKYSFCSWRSLSQNLPFGRITSAYVST